MTYTFSEHTYSNFLILNEEENMINHIVSYGNSWRRSYNIFFHAKTSAGYKIKNNIKKQLMI